MSGRYCGLEIPHPVTSFSNALVVNFISDESVSRKGFRATYTASTSSKTYQDLLLSSSWTHFFLNWSKSFSSHAHTLILTGSPGKLILFTSSTQVVEEIWWWRVVHLTVPTIQMLIRLMWSVCGPSEVHQGIVSSSHLCMRYPLDKYLTDICDEIF